MQLQYDLYSMVLFTVLAIEHFKWLFPNGSEIGLSITLILQTGYHKALV